jgi:DNA (cytosine-5)-methyltransferase 1
LLTIGSLFSGIGGFDLGFEKANLGVISWQVEIDKNCQNILKHHFPKSEKFNDIRECGRNELKPIDVICGGFPCQDLSIAGKRKGLIGERSGLWGEFDRIIEELEPRWVVIENVPGLLSSNNGWDFHTIISRLVKLGYGVVWRVLDAQYFGVPQRRRRVFIVGSLGNGRSAEVLFESESVSRNIKKGRKAREGIASTLRGRAPGSGGQGTDFEQIVANTIPAHPGICAPDYTNYVRVLAVGHSGGQTLKENNIINNITTQVGSETTAMFNGVAVIEQNTQCTTPDLPSLRAQDSPNYAIWEPRSADGAPRVHNDGICPTLNTAQGGQRQPCIGVRRLTPTECERLQGYPDGWTGGQSDSIRYKQLGNSVAVPVIKWIGSRILDVENKYEWALSENAIREHD